MLPGDARFCMECGKPVEAAGDSRPTRTPASYTPRHLAEKILTSRSALEGERKQVTVLFADLKGSVDLSGSLDPEEWHDLMNRFFALLSLGVHRFEGTINQFTGDGIMALFGAPIAHEDHAHRACYTALYLRDELRRFTEETKRTRGVGLSVRMGLNSGEVVVGRIGDDLRMDYTAHGQTVGLADRMQQLADPGTIYLSETTARLVTGFLELRDLGAFELKGIRAPTRVYELERQGTLRTRLDLSRSRGLSRFIGREREMGVLEGALRAVRDGRGQIVATIGEAGIGKSRLFYELLERCRTQGIEVHHTQGVSYGRAVPLQPILDLLRSYFGIRSDDSAAEAQRKIAGTLLLHHGEIEDALPLVFEFLGVPDPGRPAPDLDPRSSQEKLFAIFRGICSPSRREPLVLVFEDLHFFDRASEGFLAGLAEAARETPTLLLVNYRPEYAGAWLRSTDHEALRLRPLGDEAMGELLVDLLGTDGPAQELAQRIRARAAGNPFFVEEAVQSLLESGNLTGTRGAYRLALPVEELTIPPTVQALLTARIDRLDEREKGVLQTAAVIGKEFSEELLARVGELPAQELGEALRTLEGSEFIDTTRMPPCTEYAFRHPLTQEVAYRSQLTSRRSRIHAEIAKAIEDRCPERLDECAALIAHHWAEAGNPAVAAPWHLRAGRWLGPSDPAEALRHFRRVVSLLESIPDSPETLAQRVTAHAALIRFASIVAMPRDELVRIFSEGKALARRSHDPRALATLLTSYSGAQASAGDADSALKHSLKAVGLLRETGDVEFEASLRATVTFAYYAAGRLREGIEYVADLESRLTDRAVDARALDEVNPLNYVSRMFRALMLTWLGRLKEARRDLESVIRIAAERGQTYSWAHGSLVDVAFFTGSQKEALPQARAAVRSAEAYGSPFFNAAAYRALGRAHLMNDQPADAIEAVEHALSILRESRTALHLEPAVVTLGAEAYRATGDLDRARTEAETAVDLARERHTRLYELHACLVLAEILRTIDATATGDQTGSLLDAASRLLDETGARSLAPFLVVERAARAAAIGDAATQRRELEEAHRLFLEMGATQRAEALAAQLR